MSLCVGWTVGDHITLVFTEKDWTFVWGARTNADDNNNAFLHHDLDHVILNDMVQMNPGSQQNNNETFLTSS